MMKSGGCIRVKIVSVRHTDGEYAWQKAEEEVNNALNTLENEGAEILDIIASSTGCEGYVTVAVLIVYRKSMC